MSPRLFDTFNRARQGKDVETTLNNANGRASADAKTRGPKRKEKKKKKKKERKKNNVGKTTTPRYRGKGRKWEGRKDCLLAIPFEPVLLGNAVNEPA